MYWERPSRVAQLSKIPTKRFRNLMIRQRFAKDVVALTGMIYPGLQSTARVPGNSCSTLEKSCAPRRHVQCAIYSNVLWVVKEEARRITKFVLGIAVFLRSPLITTVKRSVSRAYEVVPNPARDFIRLRPCFSN